MIIKIIAVHVKDLNNVEFFENYEVDECNYKIIRKRLELEKRRIIDILKHLKEQGHINSLIRPKNFLLNKPLKNLIKARQTIKDSINKISEVYYK